LVTGVEIVLLWLAKPLVDSKTQGGISMSQEHSTSIQLEGEELQRMQQLVATADDSLRQIAKVIRAKLRKDAGERDLHIRPKVARVYFDNIRVVIDDEDGCGVYELPPGICRPCKEGE
jgi:hypothetical protein